MNVLMFRVKERILGKNFSQKPYNACLVESRSLAAILKLSASDEKSHSPATNGASQMLAGLGQTKVDVRFFTMKNVGKSYDLKDMSCGILVAWRKLAYWRKQVLVGAVMVSFTTCTIASVLRSALTSQT